MKLVTYTNEGPPRGGVVDGDSVVDLNRACHARLQEQRGWGSERAADALLPPDMLDLLEVGEEAVAEARAVLEFVRTCVGEGKELRGPHGSRVVHDLNSVRLHPPILAPRKIIGVGLNYRDHAAEQGAKIPRTPVIFSKWSNSLIGQGDAILHPQITEQLDYEAELAFVIGRAGRNIPEDRALRYVAGYCNFNDVTARDIQLSDRQWVRGKSGDTLAPMGPWLATPDEVPDAHRLGIRLWLNGDLLQDSCTDQLVFGIPSLISFLSHSFTLEPGDVVATGTPGGVGFTRNPPTFMRPGDVVAMEVEGLGRLENPIAADDTSISGGTP